MKTRNILKVGKTYMNGKLNTKDRENKAIFDSAGMLTYGRKYLIIIFRV